MQPLHFRVACLQAEPPSRCSADSREPVSGGVTGRVTSSATIRRRSHSCTAGTIPDHTTINYSPLGESMLLCQLLQVGVKTGAAAGPMRQGLAGHAHTHTHRDTAFMAPGRAAANMCSPMRGSGIHYSLPLPA